MESRRAGAPRISFKRHVRVELTPAGVYLVAPSGMYTLTGAHARAVAVLLDGTRTLAEVREAIACPSGELGRILGRLSQANLIGLHRPGRTQDEAAEAYWDLAGLDGDPGHGAVEVVSVGGTGTREAEAACRALGLRGADGADGAADLTVVLCEDYLDPRLADVNDAHLSSGRAWLPAVTTGPVHWVGPVFAPEAGPCWACLAARLREHRQGEGWLRRDLGTAEPLLPPPASLPATRAIGVQLVALHAAKRLAGERLTEVLWTLDTLTLDSRRHAVQRRPQCPSCGDPQVVAARAEVPVTVRSRPKAAGGGHRALTPERMWEKYGHLADPVTGVTGEVRRDPRAPWFTHAYLAGHNRALRFDDLEAVRAGLRARSGGKGATDLEAKVGALCEAVERYSASRFGDEQTVRDSLRGLGPEALHPNEYQLFHPRQFAGREHWNAASGLFHQVPAPFDESTPVEWTPLWSLTTGRRRWLPADVLYFHGDRDRDRLRADSNGNAAGSSLEDAILQGVLELVERDAVALWWYNRTRQPEVDLASFGDEWLTGTRAAYAGFGRALWLLDLTTDLGVPAMAAVSRRADGPAEEIMLGFGAHLDPRVAARRAVAELGQLLPAAAGDGCATADAHLLDWWRTATAARHPYLVPDPAQAPVRAADYTYTPHDNLRDDLDHLGGLITRAGLDLLVLDQTRPDLGLPVVKVIVPGLRHFWARFAEGRLYDVPVRLGRIAEPTPYDELNPIPVFL
jgi:oxazoline/thiazoline synthase